LAPALSFQVLFVAIPKEATLMPDGSERNSGSLVKFPIIKALFKYMTDIKGAWRLFISSPCEIHPTDGVLLCKTISQG